MPATPVKPYAEMTPDEKAAYVAGMRRAAAELPACAEAFLSICGCPGCWSDDHHCTCASDKAAIRDAVADCVKRLNHDAARLEAQPQPGE